MSFILDALKRSEQDRLQGVLPEGGEPQARNNRVEAKRIGAYVSIVLLSSAALVAAGFFLYWNGSESDSFPVVERDGVLPPTSDHELASTGPKKVTPTQRNGSVTNSGISGPIREEPPKNTQPPDQIVGISDRPEESPETVIDSQEVESPESEMRSDSNRVLPENEDELVADTLTDDPPNGRRDVVPKPAENKRISNELPAPPSLAMRKDVGSLKLQVHVYDPDASRRFVMIDGQMHYEGESVKPGLTVERIVQNGAVLAWKGKSFLISSSD